MVNTQPVGADLYLTRIQQGVPDKPEHVGTSPKKLMLSLGEGISYRVEARKPQYRDAVTTLSKASSDKGEVSLTLERYMATVPVTAFEILPDLTGTAARLVPVRKETAAYVATAEPSPYVRACSPLETNSGELDDLTMVTASKTEDDLHSKSCIDSSIPRLTLCRKKPT
jgi:hypothetical protein